MPVVQVLLPPTVGPSAVVLVTFQAKHRYSHLEAQFLFV
jgi:hypothetical protein